MSAVTREGDLFSPEQRAFRNDKKRKDGKWMVMKMAAVSTISLLLLCCSAISSTDSEEVCDNHVATGANFTVQLGFTMDKSDRLRWKHNSRYILDLRSNGQFVEGKKELISEDGSLDLTNVIKSNAGSYIPEVLNKDGTKKWTAKVFLCVMDPVPKPVLKTTCNKKKTISDAQFTCKVQAKTDHTFAWLQNNKVLGNETGATLTRQADKVKTDSFRCRVSNIVSSETSEPIVQICIDNNASFLPDTLLGINSWIVVGAGGGVVLLLIIVVIVCCVHTKQSKRMQLKDEGELRLPWTNDQHKHHQHNDPQDQRSHHHHHSHQQPAGHTGPRQQRSRQQHPINPDQPNAHPQPSPRRPAQAPRPPANSDDEQPPPLPQPRKIIKKAAKAQRV
ncbi:CD48 antigen-like [Anarrhichthys ocellatus]|uniref:CD48 antigen-like n=1 Tax=Anarrhichthys ocellatus TaxID=433405 RepID=UPI0012EEAAA1|nr:CD48 antigen-like [Anarrhichthys ocellatus]XP_031708025.1 CD48 antigen-like [Anarrhichthys ocellatus]